jgi:radical SAM-linked protein
VAVERAYLPWVDAIAAMRDAHVPLLTLETWTPVAEAHLLGITLQHELHYTNLLEMLDLAGVPTLSSSRAEDHPLVLVGGPACANFAPFSRFVDAVAVGDGEELFPEILTEVVHARREGTSRDEVKRRLSRIEGVYVPGTSLRVRRRVLPRLAAAPYPESCLVPLVAGVHDRAWVEVMRGCTRGCRFCQAGMWYRPVRERPAEEVLALAAGELAATGHQELAFASLSTTDYSCLQEVLSGVAATHPEVSLSLPSLRVDTASVRLAWLASPGGASLTLAPEAGSQRMRDIINKNVTEDDVIGATEEAVRSGRTTLKLYFMIGLPWETDEDVVAIADLCLRVREAGRRVLGAKAGRLQLNVSVNTFVPKPFTPFQWTAMADRGILPHRQALLRSRLRRPGIRLALSDPTKSYLEAALARGDEKTAEVIEAAWRRGARFDSWTEQFRADAWATAFAEAGTSAEAEATTPLGREHPLPWDRIEGVPSGGFLWGEWEKAQRGETSGDCRWDGCDDCGACADPPGNDLAPASALEPSGGDTAGTSPPVEVDAEPDGETPATAPLRGPTRRYVARFSVTGRGRFLGHLDRVEAFRRAVRRAGGRLALSGGMRPKPLLSLALPLGVGIEGLEELSEFELAQEPEEGFEARLAQALPGHMKLRDVVRHEGGRRLGTRVAGATYRVAFTVVPKDGEPRGSGAGPAGREAGPAQREALAEGVRRIEEAGEWIVEDVRADRVRSIELRQFLQELRLSLSPDPDPGGVSTLVFTTAITPTGTARPDLVLKALGQACGLTLAATAISRTRIHLN